MTEDKKLPTPRGLRDLQAAHDAAKGAPVYDAQGNLIGRTGEDPGEPRLTPEERMTAGFRQATEERMKAIGVLLDVSGQAAWKARHKVRPKSNYLNFSTRLAANAELRELRSQIDKNKEAISKLLSGVVGPEYADFKSDVKEALGEIDRVFKGEA